MATEVERKAGSEVAEIARRLEAAKESGVLDLSACGLLKIPDAVYMVLRGAPIQICNLSQNQLKKVPPKLPVKLDQLQELNLGNNSITELPQELAGMSELKVLDLSMNRLSVVPPVLYQCVNLMVLKLGRNAISEIDIDNLVKMSSLQEIDLCGNPLSPEVTNSLLQTRLRVLCDDVEGEESMIVD